MNPDSNIAAPALSDEASREALSKPPIARREPVEHVLHADRRVDHYAWLRHEESPKVIAYLEAENAYTDALMKPTEGFQEKLYQEMLGRMLQTDLSVPYRLRGYLYFTRTEEGKQYALHCRRRDVEGSAEELLLDLNQLAEGHSFLGLESFEVSEDNQFLAYSIDTTGFRQYTLHAKDLRTGETLAEHIERVTSVAWATDNHTLFYTVEDEITKRSHRLYRHALGSAGKDDLLYEESDERFRIEVERTRSGGYLLLTSSSHTTSEVRSLHADDPSGQFQIIAPREDNHEYYVDHYPSPPTAGPAGPHGAEPGGPESDAIDGLFYIRTNSGGRTFRLVAAPARDPRREFWREIIPNRSEVMLAEAHVFRTHLLLFEREGGLPYLRIVDLTSTAANVLQPRTALNSPSPLTTLLWEKTLNSTLRACGFNSNRSSPLVPSTTTTSKRARESLESGNRFLAGMILRNMSASACMPRLPMAHACRSRSCIGAIRHATGRPRFFCTDMAATGFPCR